MLIFQVGFLLEVDLFLEGLLVLVVDLCTVDGLVVGLCLEVLLILVDRGLVGLHDLVVVLFLVELLDLVVVLFGLAVDLFLVVHLFAMPYSRFSYS